MRTRIIPLVVVAGVLSSAGLVVAQLAGGSNANYFLDLCQDRRGRLTAAADGVCGSQEVLSTVSKGVLEYTEPAPTHLAPVVVLHDVASLSLDPGSYIVGAYVEVAVDEAGSNSFTCHLGEVGASPVDTATMAIFASVPGELVRLRLSGVVQLSSAGQVVVQCLSLTSERFGTAQPKLHALPVALQTQP